MSLGETGNEARFITFCQHWNPVWDELKKGISDTLSSPGALDANSILGIRGNKDRKRFFARILAEQIVQMLKKYSRALPGILKGEGNTGPQ
jgi:hypothetical protein